MAPISSPKVFWTLHTSDCKVATVPVSEKTHFRLTASTDLTPLQGMPLEDMRLPPNNITKGLDILRDTKSLKTIGIRAGKAWPAAEFWERCDKGEFK